MIWRIKLTSCNTFIGVYKLKVIVSNYIINIHYSRIASWQLCIQHSLVLHSGR